MPATAVPVFRWVYVKDARHLTCELSLDATHSVYELRTAFAGEREQARVEQFADVTPAILRQGQVEASLIDQGWSLEWYERDALVAH